MNEQEEKCCGTCAFFYDEWLDGTGKCDKAHGAITHCDDGKKCTVHKFYDDAEEVPDDDIPW